MLSFQDFVIISEFVTFKNYKYVKQQVNTILVSTVCGRDVVVHTTQKYGTNKYGELFNRMNGVVSENGVTWM